jgi:hypothetical protein
MNVYQVAWYNRKMERPIIVRGFNSQESAEQWMELRKKRTSGGIWRVEQDQSIKQ